MENILSLDELVNYIELITNTKNTNATDNFVENKVKKLEYNLLDLGCMESFGDLLPSKIKEFVKEDANKLYRCGVNNMYNTKTNTYNISLYNSILTSLNDDFNQMLENEKIMYINRFINVLCEDIDKDLYDKKLHNEKYRKEMKESGKEVNIESLYDIKEIRKENRKLTNNIKNMDNTKNVIIKLAEYFSVNIYIFDIDNNRVLVGHGGDNLDKYNMSIILSYFSGSYEPIFYDNVSLLKPNNNIIESFLSYNRIELLGLSNDSEFKNVELSTENLDRFQVEVQNEYTEYIDDLNIDEVDDDPGLTVTENDNIIENLSEDSEDDKSNNELFLKKKTKNNSVSSLNCSTVMPISLKMKLCQLQDIAKKHHIIISDGITKKGTPKLKTKVELYKEIRKQIGL